MSKIKKKVEENKAEQVTDIPENKDVEGKSPELEALTKENEELKDKVLRMAAEIENLRKRHEKEISNAIKYSSSSFAKEMLSVQDNMERALESMSDVKVDDDECLKNTLDGVKMVSDQIIKVFKSAGIEKVKAKGEMLNPELHQAVSQIESEDESGTIIEVLQEGYTIHGRLLRPAMVVVSQ